MAVCSVEKDEKYTQYHANKNVWILKKARNKWEQWNDTEYNFTELFRNQIKTNEKEIE